MAEKDIPLHEHYKISNDITEKELYRLGDALHQNWHIHDSRKALEDICKYYKVYLYYIPGDLYDVHDTCDENIKEKLIILYNSGWLTGTIYPLGGKCGCCTFEYGIYMTRKMILSHNNWDRAETFLNKCEEESGKEGGIIGFNVDMAGLMERFYKGFIDYAVDDYLGIVSPRKQTKGGGV